MGLRKVYPTQSLTETIWHYLVYLEARLLNDPNARDLAPKITKLVDTIEHTAQGQRSRWRAEIVAQALVDYANYLLDQQTARFSRVLLSQDDIALDTNHPRYTRYFTIPLSRVIRMALAPQIKFMRPWINSIKTESVGAVQTFAGIFSDIINQGENALHKQDESVAARKDFRVRDINLLVKQINDSCQEVYGALKARAPSLSLPADWADGFFYTPRNASSSHSPAEHLQSAIYSVFKAHGQEVSEAVDEKIQSESDLVMLQGWLVKALQASSPEEVVGLPPGEPA